MMRVSSVVVLASVAGIASAGELGDVGLVLQNGQLITGLADDVAGTIDDLGERVFAGELTFDNLSGFAVGDDPGFFTNSGAGIAVGSTIRYDTVAALRQWTGFGFGGTIASLLQIQGLSTIVTPTVDEVVAGYGYTYNGGDFDEHPDYALDGSNGIYLWQVEFELLDPTGNLVDRTDTIYIVFNYGLSDTELDLAIEYVETNIIPAPGAAALLGLGGLAAARRRR